MPGLKVLHLLLGLSKVGVDGNPELLGQGSGLPPHLRAAGIRGMRREGAPDTPFSFPIPLADESLRLLKLRFSLGRGGSDDPIGKQGPEADFLHRGRHLLHEEVHVGETGGARADHLPKPKEREPVHILGGELFLRRPDPVLKPAHEGKIVGKPPEQGHGKVRVGVDKARDEEFPFPIYNPIEIPSYPPSFHHRGIPPSLDGHIGLGDDPLLRPSDHRHSTN